MHKQKINGAAKSEDAGLFSPITANVAPTVGGAYQPCARPPDIQHRAFHVARCELESILKPLKIGMDLLF